MDTGFNAAVALREDGRLMGLLHAGYGVGAAIGPVVVGASLGSGAGWRPAYVVFAATSLLLVLPLAGRSLGEAPPAAADGLTPGRARAVPGIRALRQPRGDDRPVGVHLAHRGARDRDVRRLDLGGAATGSRSRPAACGSGWPVTRCRSVVSSPSPWWAPPSAPRPVGGWPRRPRRAVGSPASPSRSCSRCSCCAHRSGSARIGPRRRSAGRRPPPRSVRRPARPWPASPSAASGSGRTAPSCWRWRWRSPS